MTLPLVSIVTPSFNQGRFIADTIDSVLSQDYPRIEYIVVDGGSTDGTLDVLRRYGDRLRWISEPDGGQAAAINRGWRMARGEIVAWLNSDDVYRPGAVRAIVDAWAEHPEAGAIFGGCDYLSPTGAATERYPTYPFDIVQVLRTGHCPIPQPAAFIRRVVVDAVGGLNESLYCTLDYEYWLRIGLRYPIVYLPVALAGYRVHPAAKTVAQRARCGPEMVSIFRHLFADPDLPPRFRALQRDGMGSILLEAAQYAFAGGCLPESRRYLLQGWAYRPFRLRRFMMKILIVNLLGRSAWSAWMRFRRWRGAKLGVFERNLM